MSNDDREFEDICSTTVHYVGRLALAWVSTDDEQTGICFASSDRKIKLILPTDSVGVDTIIGLLRELKNNILQFEKNREGNTN
jgi:hypothetical protein